MASKHLSLDIEQVTVSSFPTTETSTDVAAARLQPADGFSWPDVCTCIDICRPSEDIYCSGGCPPETTIIEY